MNDTTSWYLKMTHASMKIALTDNIGCMPLNINHQPPKKNLNKCSLIKVKC